MPIPTKYPGSQSESIERNYLQNGLIKMFIFNFRLSIFNLTTVYMRKNENDYVS